jgi:hypothetical protein
VVHRSHAGRNSNVTNHPKHAQRRRDTRHHDRAARVWLAATVTAAAISVLVAVPANCETAPNGTKESGYLNGSISGLNFTWKGDGGPPDFTGGDTLTFVGTWSIPSEPLRQGAG